MAGARSVSYEVYYLQYGRWQIHHRYGFSERDQSIEEAKRLDSQGHFDAACVVRESYDEGSGTSSESVIYHSPTLKAKPPVAFITAGSDGSAKPSAAGAAAASGMRALVKNAPAGSAAANAMADARKKAAARKAASKQAPKQEPELRRPPKARGEEADWSQAVPKILLAFVVSVVAGTLAGMAILFGLEGLSSLGIDLSRQVDQVLLIGAWFSGWLLTFVPLLRRILANTRRNVDTEPVPQKAQDSQPRRDDEAEARKALSDAATALAALEEKSDAPDPEQDTKPAVTEQEAGPADAEDVPAVEKLDEIPPPPAAEESGGAQLRAALTELVAEAKRLSNGTLDKDQFLRFGVILFLAGAAETLARRFKVAAREVTAILSDQIQSLGVSSSMALGFAANIDEYLLDPRYFDMYSQGRGGALKRGDDPKSDSGMRAAFEMWKTPKKAPGQDPATADDPKHYDGTPGDKEAYGFVSVLFTDIVNSTKKQQENGDEWLMNVVRAHNDIVREAISRHGGREIKHTGDGIMASFPAVIGSVEAALAMQDGIGKFSEMMPDLAFEICVGISAGEPIHESGDLFGTPVNLAARVLSKASAKETAVSSIVREMCRGKSFVFEEIGRFDLKGFEEPQPIYRVIDRRKKARGSGTEPAVARAG